MNDDVRNHLMDYLWILMSDALEEEHGYGTSWEEENWAEWLPKQARLLVAGLAHQGNRRVISLKDAERFCSIADLIGHWVDSDGHAFKPECDK